MFMGIIHVLILRCLNEVFQTSAAAQFCVCWVDYYMSIHKYGEYNDLVNETIVRWCLLIEEIVSLLTGLSPPSADTVFLIYVSKIWTQQMMDTANLENFHNHHLWMYFLDRLLELQLDLYKSSFLAHEGRAAKTFFGFSFYIICLNFVSWSIIVSWCLLCFILRTLNCLVFECAI